MSICLINEPGRIFGSALVARRWKEISKRKEYDPFRKAMLYILAQAEKNKLYCPDIFIKNNLLTIRYSNDDRYVNFYIDRDEKISYEYWTSGEERNYHLWGTKSRMPSISAFINGE